MTHSMKLSHLLYHFYDSTLYADVDITGLALDSRKVKPGDLFFACRGTQQDGKLFINDAIKNGAKAVLEDVSSPTILARNEQNVPIFPVDHLGERIGPIAAEFYGHPSRQLKVIGITGTNGKTSCSYFIAEALQFCKINCGVVGTLGSGLYGHIQEGSLTTPDAITLQSTLNDLLQHHAKVVAMEVSSHSIDQSRIKGIDFDIAIFTNLTRDHLDYHGTMEEYGKTKQKLFDPSTSRLSVINIDDPFGLKMLKQLPKATTYAYAIENTDFTQVDRSHLILATSVTLENNGMKTHISTPWGEGWTTIPLLGQFNLSNVLATLTALCLLKIPFDKALEALSHLSSVPGRMQKTGGDNKPIVVVDYAHTPDALEKVLIALKSHSKGKLLCLFGCGGDRDRGKRPLMAKVVEQYADYIVVTDDNPRTEDPDLIVSDILSGFTHPKKINVEHNRSKAIRDIIQYARSNDCVLIAGKGAETYQHIGLEKIPFSDIQKVTETLNARMVK